MTTAKYVDDNDNLLDCLVVAEDENRALIIITFSTGSSYFEIACKDENGNYVSMENCVAYIHIAPTVSPPVSPPTPPLNDIERLQKVNKAIFRFVGLGIVADLMDWLDGTP